MRPGPWVAGNRFALLGNAGLTLADIKGSPVPNTSRGGEDFVQGKCDSAVMALGAARLTHEESKGGGLAVGKSGL